MGCGQQEIFNNYKLMICSLESRGNNLNYEIRQIAEKSIPKVQNEKLLSQCESCANENITNFISRPRFKEKTLFYFYVREEPIIKFFNQIENYYPENYPNLKGIIMLSLDNLDEELPLQIIEKMTFELQYKHFDGQTIDLTETKENYLKAQNPNITKDSLTLSNSEEDQEEEKQEKDDEITICDDVNRNTLQFVRERLFEQNEDEGGVGLITPKVKRGKQTIESAQKTLAGEEEIEEEEDEKGERSREEDDNTRKVRKSGIKIKTVKIIGSKFSQMSYFFQMMDNLKEYGEIRKFSFYDNIINNDFGGWGAIAEFLEECYALRFLDLHSSNLYDQHLDWILPSLTDKRIRVINLSENFLTQEGMKIFCKYLKNCKTLQRVYFQRNAQCQFKSEGVNFLIQSLENNPNIQLIDISFMDLTGCGVFIAPFMKKCKSLNTINLRSCNLNLKDFKNIFEAVEQSKSIKEIDVSYNDMGSDKSLEIIANAINKNRSLVCLKLEHMNINNDNYEIIFNAIKNNNMINSYYLSYNYGIKAKILLNFFMGQRQVKYLEYIPYDDEDGNKGQDFTLEEKKMVEKFKTDRPDMKIVCK